jgi:glycosyltransferase involved in cell wall biosynthesis
MNRDSFEITIPVLNEEKELEKNIYTIHNYLLENFSDQKMWSIVIADNGSNDGTQRIAQSMVNKYSWLKYIRLEQKGVGRALKAAWSQSNASIVGYMDLDLATDLKYLTYALSAISEKNYDIVYGTRLHKNSTVIRRSLKREITSRVFNFILKIYLQINFSDGMCGFKFLKRNIFKKLYDGGAVSDGWFFSTELLTVAEWFGYKMYELPVHWTDSSDSQANIIRLTIEYLKAMKTLKKRKKLIK